MFLPQGLFSLVLAVAGSPISRGVAINSGTAAVPGWPSPSCMCWAVLLDPGQVPQQSHALFWGGDLIPCPEFPHGLCGGERHLQGKCRSPQFCAAVPQGSSRAGGPGVSQNPKLSTLLVKEGQQCVPETRSVLAHINVPELLWPLQTK